MKINVIIERGTDGTYDAHFDSNENNTLTFSLLGQGDTAKEAIDDFYSSYGEIKEMYAEKGKVVEDMEFIFKYDIASFLQYYAYAFTLSGVSRITGISQGQLSHYINGVRKPSPKTAKQIEERIHAFADEIGQVRFV